MACRRSQAGSIVCRSWLHFGSDSATNIPDEFFCDFFTRAGSGTYLDIGANIGLTTIPVAQNPRVACKAFEPAPHNFRYLSHNVAANCPHGNVDLFNLALFDRRATMTMG